MNKYIRVFLLSFVGFNMSAVSLTQKELSDIRKNIATAHKAIEEGDTETLVKLENGMPDKTTRRKAQKLRSKGLKDNTQNRVGYLSHYYPTDYTDLVVVAS